MKRYKRFLFSLLAVSVLTGCLFLSEKPLSATLGGSEEALSSETDPTDNPATEESEPLSAESSEECICGRPYYTADGEGHRQFDCIGCNRNDLSCTCGCWCGADSYSSV